MERNPAHIVVILAAQVHRVDVHAAVVSPIVDEGDDQLDSRLLRRVDHLVKRLQVDGGRAVRPPLEDDVGGTGPFASIVRQATVDKGGVPVIESPGAKYFQARPLCRREAQLDVGLVLSTRSATVVARSISYRSRPDWEVDAHC